MKAINGLAESVKTRTIVKNTKQLRRCFGAPTESNDKVVRISSNTTSTGQNRSSMLSIDPRQPSTTQFANNQDYTHILSTFPVGHIQKLHTQRTHASRATKYKRELCVKVRSLTKAKM